MVWKCKGNSNSLSAEQVEATVHYCKQEYGFLDMNDLAIYFTLAFSVSSSTSVLSATLGTLQNVFGQ